MNLTIDPQFCACVHAFITQLNRRNVVVICRILFTLKWNFNVQMKRLVRLQRSKFATFVYNAIRSRGPFAMLYVREIRLQCHKFARSVCNGIFSCGSSAML